MEESKIRVGLATLLEMNRELERCKADIALLQGESATEPPPEPDAAAAPKARGKAKR